MGKWIGLGLLGALALLVLWGVGSYNSLVKLDQQVQAQWGQVENVYERRADLVPNLVETVKGAANFERETLTQVVEARAKATSTTVNLGPQALENPEAFEQFQQAQQNLSGALSRLLVSVERYPELRATENFRTLQSQLEGTENRIAVERMRFNEAARQYNTARSTFPTVVYAKLFGARFKERPYFRAERGAERPPRVNFGS